MVRNEKEMIELLSECCTISVDKSQIAYFQWKGGLGLSDDAEVDAEYTFKIDET